MKIKNKIMLSAFTLTIGSLIPTIALVSCSAAFPDDYIITGGSDHSYYIDSNGIEYHIRDDIENYYEIPPYFQLGTDAHTNNSINAIKENTKNGILDLRNIVKPTIKVKEDNQKLESLEDYENLKSYKTSSMIFSFEEINPKLTNKVKQIINTNDLFYFSSQMKFFPGFYDTTYLFPKDANQEIIYYSIFSKYWQHFQLLDQMEDYGNPKKIVVDIGDDYNVLYYSHQIPEIIFFNGNLGWYKEDYYSEPSKLFLIKNDDSEGNAAYWGGYNPFEVWLSSIHPDYSPTGRKGLKGKRIYINKEMQNFPCDWWFLQGASPPTIDSASQEELNGWVSNDKTFDSMIADYQANMTREFKKFNRYYGADMVDNDGVKYDDLYTIKIFLAQPMHLYGDLIKESFKSMQEMITQYTVSDKVNSERTWPLNKPLPPNTRRIFKFIEPGNGDLNDPYEKRWNDEAYRNDKFTYKGNM